MKNENIPADVKSKSLKEAREEINDILMSPDRIKRLQEYGYIVSFDPEYDGRGCSKIQLNVNRSRNGVNNVLYKELIAAMTDLVGVYKDYLKVNGNFV